MKKAESIMMAAEAFAENYGKEPLFQPRHGKEMPKRAAVIQFIRDLRQIMFPGYFGEDSMRKIDSEHFATYRINHLYDVLKREVETAIWYMEEGKTKEDVEIEAERICSEFFVELPDVQRILLTDVQAGYDGDPAAKSKEEIIFCYPGLLAIYVYRVAHILYEKKVPLIPRIMTEYVHGRTGIDINPGAEIGEYFFIDHGTGIVIGETTKIGKYVKLYQGVTLGALSTRDGQQLSGVKRHPTIEDHVTIYSNSSVLGGETVIGENTIIGGNTFITRSIPANTKVSAKSPELVIKSPKKHAWDWED